MSARTPSPQASACAQAQQDAVRTDGGGAGTDLYPPEIDLAARHMPIELLYLAERIGALESIIAAQCRELGDLQCDILRQDRIIAALACSCSRHRTPRMDASSRSVGPRNYASLKEITHDPTT